jgi:hypothetical protein
MKLPLQVAAPPDRGRTGECLLDSAPDRERENPSVPLAWLCLGSLLLCTALPADHTILSTRSARNPTPGKVLRGALPDDSRTDDSRSDERPADAGALPVAAFVFRSLTVSQPLAPPGAPGVIFGVLRAAPTRAPPHLPLETAAPGFSA